MDPVMYRFFSDLNQAIQTSILDESGMSFHPLAARQHARQKSGVSLGLLTGTLAFLSAWMLTDERTDGAANFVVNSYSIHSPSFYTCHYL